MKKKGSLQDVAFWITSFLFLGILILVSFKGMSEINDNLQVNPLINAEGRTASQEVTDMFPGVIDNGILFLAIGVALASIILAALVRVHPIFMVFFFLGLIVLIIIAAAMSNVYQELEDNPQLATEAAQLTFTSFILNFLPLLVGVLGTILMIVLYKTRDFV